MARKRVKGKKKSAYLQWRSEQPRGAIMSPETFKKIEENAAKNPKYKNPTLIAGKAYQVTAKAKFKKAQAKKRKRVKG